MDFKISSWNIRGLNDPLKHKEVRNFVKKEDLKILSILESKVKQCNEQSIFGKIFKNWAFLSNSNSVSNGRIWICWDPNFCTVNPIYQSEQLIFCNIHMLEPDLSFQAGFVYAENKHCLRVPLFCKLVDLASQKSNVPTVWMGDFNAIRYLHEKVGGSNSWSSDKEFFNASVLQASLDDITYVGCQFTWANKQTDGHYIASKIDRVLGNDKWLQCFPSSFACFDPTGPSDHSPAILTIVPKGPSYRKPFKFFNMWATHPEFLPIVREVWSKYISGSPMFRIYCKL